MEVLAIEMQVGKEIVKADIMRKLVAFKKINTVVKLSPVGALANSLNFYGKVDMPYIVQTTGLSREEVLDALKGDICYNPATGEWEHKGKFLAGNVIAKREEIASYLPELTGEEREWKETTVQALADCTPEPIPYEELDINMGERWIDTALYADFAT